MGLPVTALYDLAQDVLTAIQTDWPGECEPLPDRAYVSDGTLIWDGCESLVVLVDSTFGTNADVAGEEIITAMGGIGFAMRAVNMGVAILRCVPMVDDNGSAPSPAEVDASAQVILSDHLGAFEQLVNAHRRGDLGQCSAVAFERWQTEGPQGGIGGGTLRFRALL